MASTLARFESSDFLPVETSKTPLLIQLLLTTRGTSPSHCGYLSGCPQLPGISERMRRSKMRRVGTCTEPHGGHFEHILL
jgi:hypothetical protein